MIKFFTSSRVKKGRKLTLTTYLLSITYTTLFKPQREIAPPLLRNKAYKPC